MKSLDLYENGNSKRRSKPFMRSSYSLSDKSSINFLDNSLLLIHFVDESAKSSKKNKENFKVFKKSTQ